MNVSLKNIDATRGIVKLEIGKEDYAGNVEKSLRSFRQKANIPGFRKGMVPMGMIRKMYGKHVLAEEINKLVSENLYTYIRENNLNILGEPLPNETEQKENNFDTDELFEFCFDIAMSPEIKIGLSKEDRTAYYQINIDEQMIDKQVESYRSNFGTFDEADQIASEQDLVKGRLAELENGTPKEGGIVVEEASLMPLYFKDEEEKAKFVGTAKHTVVVFNPNKAYEGAAAELSSFLRVDKEAVASITGDFSFEITQITHHQPAELNQDLFDKVFGEGAVANEEDFREKVRQTLLEQYQPQVDFKFLLDIREMLVQKAGELVFAEDLLKRWLLLANEKNTKESVEQDYPKIIEDLKYHLIKETLVKENGLKVEEADVETFAKRVAKAQFVQYGMLSVPDDALDNYAKSLLKDKQTLQNIIDRAVEEKLAGWLKEQVTLDIKEVTPEEFNRLFEA